MLQRIQLHRGLRVRPGGRQKRTRPRRYSVAKAIAEIPLPTKNFLRLLGVDLRRAVEVGFPDVLLGVMQIAEEANLSKREKKIVEARIKGQSLQELGGKGAFGKRSEITGSRVGKIQARIVKKLNEAILDKHIRKVGLERFLKEFMRQ